MWHHWLWSKTLSTKRHTKPKKFSEVETTVTAVNSAQHVFRALILKNYFSTVNFTKTQLICVVYHVHSIVCYNSTEIKYVLVKFTVANSFISWVRGKMCSAELLAVTVRLSALYWGKFCEVSWTTRKGSELLLLVSLEIDVQSPNIVHSLVKKMSSTRSLLPPDTYSLGPWLLQTIPV